MAAGTGADRAGELIRRVLAGLFALFWIGLPGFGLIDLTETLEPKSDGYGVLEAAWGLFVTLFLGMPFAIIAIRGRGRSDAATVMLYAAAAVLVVSVVIALEGPAVVMVVVLAVQVLIVSGSPAHRLSSITFQVSLHPLIILVALGAVPWLVYAWQMGSLNRQSLPDADITMGVDHYAVQGAYALALLVLLTLAAWYRNGRVLLGVTVGASAAYLGAVSWFWYPTPGGFTPVWSVLCVAWGVAVVVVTVLTRRLESRHPAGRAARRSRPATR